MIHAMADSSAIRQARRREKLRRAGYRQVTIDLSPEAYRKLDRLARNSTLAKAIEHLILACGSL
jgi:molybdenum cofactor biosynthesis enzyme MoaA